jgi:hypothetical protein
MGEVKITKMANDKSVRDQMVNVLGEVVENSEGQIGTSEWLFGFEDLKGQMRGVTIKVTVKKDDFNIGDSVDEYEELVLEKAAIAEEKAIAKAKKIAADEKKRAAKKAKAE